MPNESTPLLEVSTPAQHHNLAGLSAWRFRLICAAVWSGTFLVALDGTVVATLLTPIGSAFNASNLVSWLGTSYLLALCCFTPIYGRLADLIGRRGASLTAATLFTTGTVLCAIAPTMWTLIAARAIAGMGGGGLASTGVIIMTDLVDLRHRALFQGYANILFGLGGALGGPAGGWISDKFGWRMAFGAQIPLLAISWSLLLSFLPKPAKEDIKKESYRTKLARIDYMGSLTLVISIASLLLAVSIKTSTRKADGGDYAWSDPLIWGLLVGFAVFTVLFVLVEAKFAVQPILPMSLLTRRTPAAVAISLLVVVTNQFSLMYNIPLFFSVVKLQSAGAAGAHLIPYTASIGVGSLSAGWMMRKTGTYWWVGVTSGLLMVASAGLLLLWKQAVPEWLTWLAPLPAGLGYAGVLTCTLVALMTDVTRAGKGEVAVATSMSYLFRTTGQVLGVAFSAAIVQSVIQKDLSQSLHGPDAEEIINQIRHSTSSIPNLKPEIRNLAVQAYDHALHVVFIVNFVLSLLGVLGMMCIKEEEMPKQQRAGEIEDEEE